MLIIDSYSKDIAAAVTAENLVKDGGGYKKASTVLITCPSANTSDLLLGVSSSQDILIPKGTTLNLRAVLNRMGFEDEFDLEQLYIKAGTNGDDVGIMIMVRDS